MIPLLLLKLVIIQTSLKLEDISGAKKAVRYLQGIYSLEKFLL